MGTCLRTLTATAPIMHMSTLILTTPTTPAILTLTPATLTPRCNLLS